MTESPKYTFDQLAEMSNAELGRILDLKQNYLNALQRKRWAKAGRIMFLQVEIEKEEDE